MTDVKWIKITTDIFDDEKILLIESLPDAYAIITCWFKLLCLAGKQNNSGVFMMGTIAYTEKMLATIFRMKESIVEMSLNVFSQFGMIEIIDGVITIPNWNKHQTLDSYEKKKERDRIYQAERRMNQMKLIGKSSDSKTIISSDSQTIESSDIAISDKEKDKEEDNYIYSAVIAYLNEVCGTSYRANTESTKRLIHARIQEGFTLDDFKCVIGKKASEWGKDPKMCKYLRPATLFGTKFESYLNQGVKTNGNSIGHSSTVYGEYL